jgi:outer membrane protein OmpA-like peptidoglycan-associated protein
VSATAQDESTEDLIRKLKGQAAAGGSGAPATRGMKTRSLGGAAAPATSSETRSLYFSTRGIPKAVQAAAEEDQVKMKTTTAPSSSGAGDYSVAAGEEAVEINYQVDPSSKVTRDNILFRKGSADFADDASVEVVVGLAEALKSPELQGLKYVIEGHASSEGNAHANQMLSQQRAEQIVSVLTSLGVDSHSLLPVGFGETQARFPDHSPDALLKQDRRVLIYRLDQ